MNTQTIAMPIGVPHAPTAEHGIDNLLLLIRRELADPLQRLAQTASRVGTLYEGEHAPATLSARQALAETVDLARHCAAMTTRLIDLGDVLNGSPLVDDERVLMADCLRQAALQHEEMARERGIDLRLDPGRDNLAPVYGSSQWLVTALSALVGQLVVAAPRGSHLLLHLRQVGFHQLLTGSVGPTQPSLAATDLLRHPAAAPRVALAAALRIDELDLILARAVLEMHGGALKAAAADGGVLSGFQLTLPTGDAQAVRQRRDCGQCPYQQQAEQFAQDIGVLLSGEPEASKAKGESGK